MAADGLDDGDAPVKQVSAQVLDLAHPRPDVVVFDAFHNAARHGFHVAPGKPAVGVQPFVDHDHVARFFVKSFVVGGQPAADIHQRIFLGAHGAALGVGAVLLQDLRHFLRAVARFALLDEVGVLDARVASSTMGMPWRSQSSRARTYWPWIAAVPPPYSLFPQPKRRESSPPPPRG